MKRSILLSLALGSWSVFVLACSGGSGPIGSSGENPGATDPEGSGSGGEAREGGSSPTGPHSSPDGGIAIDGGDGGNGHDPADDDAEIGLTFQGCSPVFDNVRVVTNVVAFDSLAVTSAYAPLNGQVQIAIKDPTPRTIAISSTERSDSQNGVVINVMAGGTTHTNFCNASAVGGCRYNAGAHQWDNDPISGTFSFTNYDPQNGKLDVVFTNVVLQAVSGTNLCTVNGTLRTKRLSK